MELRWPSEQELPGYVAALERGWSADTMRPEAAAEELAAIREDPAAFLASLVDREGTRPPIVQPDGATRRRVPGYRKWMWDGELCGSIGLRWLPGTSVLPAHVPGHIGYSVVPWKRRLGYATTALGLILHDARAEGLDRIEVTTDCDNVGSQRVIEANGGVLVERFASDGAVGQSEGYRYRIVL